MTTLHARPYSIDAAGFYFTDNDDYQAKAKCHLDRFGNLVEEFEIQFIDGDDAELFKACEINQTNLDTWFDEIEMLDEQDKLNLYYLVGVAGYTLEQGLEKLDEPNIYHDCVLDAATELFDECMLPEVPENIRFYIDYEKFAKDCELSGDMVEFEFNNRTYTCTNASSV